MADYVVESKPAIIEQDSRVVMRVVLASMLLGLIAWALTYILQHFVLRAIFCQNPSAVCTNLSGYSGGISAIIVMVIGVVMLVRIGVYRPLLVALCVMVSLWGLASWINGLGIFESIFWTVGLYAVAYTLYSWLARLRSAVIMLVVILLVVLITRVAPLVLK
jgi:hypothetical protein